VPKAAPPSENRPSDDDRTFDQSLREETSRDAAARERDELATERDRNAGSRDDEADKLDRAGRFERPPLLVRDLRSRRRSADDRARAHGDRRHAARDREFAALDRRLAAHERRQAATDELTGARRRGAGLEELGREIDRARRTGGSLVAVFVDVDNLKSVNDVLGHRAGDELLREVADGLRRHTRSYDLLVRLGGDEFLCALPDVTLEVARARFDDLAAELHEGPANSSVSAGFSELRDGDSPRDLIDRADRDLLAVRSE
jgi:diguanylate cyclase (GGDEF)-like protein